MNTHPKLQEPFAFWLVRQVLPNIENQEEDIQPISNREFYSMMGMIIVVLAVLNIIFHGLPF
jgi:hypothetical protein